MYSVIKYFDPFISQPGWQFSSHCSALVVVVVIDGVVVVVVVEVVASVVVKDVVGASVVVVVVVPAQDELDEASSETLIPSAWSPVTQALLPNEIEEDESLIDQDPSAPWLRMKSPFCQPSAPFLNR